MTKASTTKKAAGRRLNKEGRLSPVDVLQAQMEYWSGLMNEQIAKGTRGDPELISEYSAKAQKFAESLAPYRHARISPTDEQQGSQTTTKVIRVGPIHQFKPGEEAQWLAVYGDKNEVERAISDAAASDKADEIIQRARGGVPVELPDLPAGKLN